MISEICFHNTYTDRLETLVAKQPRERAKLAFTLFPSNSILCSVSVPTTSCSIIRLKRTSAGEAVVTSPSGAQFLTLFVAEFPSPWFDHQGCYDLFVHFRQRQKQSQESDGNSFQPHPRKHGEAIAED
ncbi:hypothetical protein K1719_037626 [Acacia pycnantha]|nr:hypothetical protein K1719_037626 [Acacia pycnantha]